MDTGLGGGVANDADGLARAFASAGIGLGALAANWQAAQMTDATITFDSLQAFEVHADFAAQIAFNHIFAILDGVDDLRELLFAQIFGANAGIDFRVGKDVLGVGGANAVNVAQGDINALVWRYFDADDASHFLLIVESLNR